MTDQDAPLVFKGSARRRFVFLLPMLLVSIAGLLHRDGADVALNRFLKGGAIVAGATALVILAQVLLRPPTLALTSSGFRASFGFTSRDYSWSEYHDFSVWTHGDLAKIRFLRKGHDGDCTLDNLYDASIEEICKALNTWSQRYGHGI